MKRSLRNNWRAFAIAGGLAAAGALIACRLTPGCLLGPAIGMESPAHDASVGETAAFPDIQTPREIEYADRSTFQQKVLSSDVPVLVDFYADWCGPCRLLAPTLEEFARETPGARVVKVDVDQNPQLALRYGISAIPSLKVFKDGEIVAEHVGLAGKDQLMDLLGR